MATACSNNLLAKKAANQLCKAFGIKISPSSHVVVAAHNAGFDALFIDLEHAWLSLDQAPNLCHVALLTGISPFVRVPFECGTGFVQRVLDGGAAGIIFPHCHSASEARAAVRKCKYPPMGVRSMTGSLPILGLKSTPVPETIEKVNSTGSTVFVMIEDKSALSQVDEIASVQGADVLLVGSLDLSIDLGIGGQFTHDLWKSSVQKVSDACKKHGKIFAIAGIYNNPELQDWAINELGARFMLIEQDGSLISGGAVKAAKAVPDVKS